MSSTDLSGLWFQLHVIPPPYRLDWTQPKRLLRKTLWNHFIRDLAPIGHLFVEFDLVQPNAYGVKKVLTGMSRLDSRKSSVKVFRERVGLGSFFLDFEGKLDHAADALHENEWALKRNRLRTIRVPITPEQSRHMEQQLDLWIRSGAYRHYGGGHQVLLAEGAGCAEFGMFFLSIALEGNATRPEWVRDVIAPKKFTGRPKTDARISMVDLFLKGNEWALQESDGFRYRTPDPELIFDDLAQISPQELTTTLTRDTTFWMKGGERSLPRIQGTPRPEVVSEAEVRTQWQRVSVSAV